MWPGYSFPNPICSFFLSGFKENSGMCKEEVLPIQEFKLKSAVGSQLGQFAGGLSIFVCFLEVFFLPL